MGKSKKTKQEAAQPQELQNLPKSSRRDAPMMRVDNICPDPRNSRRLEITPENDPKLLELAESIKQFGDVLEPLVLRLRSEEDIKGDYCPDCHYMLVSGHRRLAAAKLAGLETIHCSVWENLSDRQAFEMQLVENLHRSDLLPTEEADAYKRMSEELGYTYAEIALRVGKSEKHIGRYMKMTGLPNEIKDRMDKGDISITKAQFLCSLPNVVIDDILGCRTYLLGERLAADDMRQSILATYFKKLKGSHIKFDLDKEYTDEDGDNWPACSRCPHKNQMELFAEFADKGDCPFSDCLNAKNYCVEDEERQERKDDDESENEFDSDDGDNRTPSQSSEERELKRELERKIREAVEREQFKWFMEKKIEAGFNPTDVFFGREDMLSPYCPTELLNEAYSQYIGKDENELKQSGTWEEIIKAMVIYEIYDAVNSEDYEEICEWLGCEECPDELLQKARDEAIKK